jgi:hypothetical protein
VRQAELGAPGATFGLSFFGFFSSRLLFGFFSSRLLRFWLFAMSLPPSDADKGSMNLKRDNSANLSRRDRESQNSFALAAGTSAVG